MAASAVRQCASPWPRRSCLLGGSVLVALVYYVIYLRPAVALDGDQAHANAGRP
jgi:hypothetical protein